MAFQYIASSGEEIHAQMIYENASLLFSQNIEKAVRESQKNAYLTLGGKTLYDHENNPLPRPLSQRASVNDLLHRSQALTQTFKEKLANTLRFAHISFPPVIASFVQTILLSDTTNLQAGDRIPDLGQPHTTYHILACDTDAGHYTFQTYKDIHPQDPQTISINKDSNGYCIKHKDITYNEARMDGNLYKHLHTQHLQIAQHAKANKDFISIDNITDLQIQQHIRNNLHDLFDEIVMTDRASHDKSSYQQHLATRINKKGIQAYIPAKKHTYIEQLLFLDLTRKKEKASSPVKREEYISFLRNGIAFREDLARNDLHYFQAPWIIYDTTWRGAQRFSGNNRKIGSKVLYHQGTSTPKYIPLLSIPHIQQFLKNNKKHFAANIDYIYTHTDLITRTPLAQSLSKEKIYTGLKYAYKNTQRHNNIKKILTTATEQAEKNFNDIYNKLANLETV